MEYDDQANPVRIYKKSVVLSNCETKEKMRKKLKYRKSKKVKNNNIDPIC